jgi:hypothetical protein
MTTATKEINIPLNDIRHLLLNPDCDPFKDRNLTISGLKYAVKQLRMKTLPENIQLSISLPKSAANIDLANIKESLNRHCLNIVKEKEEEYCYLNWQIKKNFKRAFLPLLIIIFAVGSIMYHIMDERSRIIQILLILLNNCVIILGWVLLWIPAEMFFYEAPRIKREIELYKLLANAEIRITQEAL